MMPWLAADPTVLVADAVRGVWGLARVAVVVAAGSSPKDIDPSTGKGPEWGKAAPIGLLVIVLLGVACYFLARSMSKNLRRVPDAFEGTGSSGGLTDGAAPIRVGPTGAPSTGVGEAPATRTNKGRRAGGPGEHGKDVRS